MALRTNPAAYRFWAPASRLPNNKQPHPIAFAALLHGGILLYALLEQSNGLFKTELRLFEFGGIRVFVLQKAHQLQLRVRPNGCLQALTNQLALDF